MNLTDRLDNWGNVWRLRIGASDTYSIECSYRSVSARHWDYDAVVGTAPVARPGLDPADALRVENAVGAIDLFHHVILKGHYVRQWTPEKTVREARTVSGVGNPRGRGDFDASMAMARALLAGVIDRPAVIRRERALKAVAAALGIPVGILGADYEYA